MRLLFDTHTFLWWHGERAQLSPRVLELCEQPEHELFLSIATIWELQIKHHLNKLKLTRSLAAIIELEQATNNISLLSISPTHIYSLYNLPHHHRDPFDRLLIAQAQTENLSLLSVDPAFAQYEVQTIW
jgi:PIN domain nuclease of toxin-antitoxin system